MSTTTHSAATTAAENLDERIERIRKRNEELEKKHREAEEDRLMALKDNAMVRTKQPVDNDWPKGHRYDTLDFTYDQPKVIAAAAAANVSDESDDATSKVITRKMMVEGKHGRDYYKKFADGQGPPPDPSYNFLADAERDGEKSQSDKKDWRQQQQQPSNGMVSAKNRGGLNNSFKGRNGKPRNQAGPVGNGSGGGGGGNNRYNNNGKHDGNNDFNLWKNERERIDEARIGRQKIGEGKWRREWDSDKFNEDESGRKDKNQHQHQHGHALQTQQHQPLHQRSPNHDQRSGGCQRNAPTVANELPIEKRGTIMVSVSQDGEVKSVKLQSTKAIGTGRVGLRQSPPQKGGQQFGIQPQNSSSFSTVNHYQQQQQPLPHQQYQPEVQLLHQQQHQQHPHQQQQHYQQQYQNQYYDMDASALPIIAAEPISPRPFFDGRPNLQDRLQRHRQPITAADPTGNSRNNVFDAANNCQDSSSPVAVGY